MSRLRLGDDLPTLALASVSSKVAQPAGWISLSLASLAPPALAETTAHEGHEGSALAAPRLSQLDCLGRVES
jgi:hypothetical protein